jgi:hypothetical protein
MSEDPSSSELDSFSTYNGNQNRHTGDLVEHTGLFFHAVGYPKILKDALDRVYLAYSLHQNELQDGSFCTERRHAHTVCSDTDCITILTFCDDFPSDMNFITYPNHRVEERTL